MALQNLTPLELVEAVHALEGKKADKSLETFIVLSASGWGSAAPYVQTVANNMVTAQMNPLADLIVSGDASGPTQVKEWAYVDKIETLDKQVRVTCFENKPSVGLSIRLKVVY